MAFGLNESRNEIYKNNKTYICEMLQSFFIFLSSKGRDALCERVSMLGDVVWHNCATRSRLKCGANRTVDWDRYQFTFELCVTVCFAYD